MKRILLTFICLLAIAMGMTAKKIGMLVPGENRSQAETNAIAWFGYNYGSENVMAAATNLSEYSVLWVMIDRVDLPSGAENLPLSATDKTLIEAWVRNGGCLLVSGHATQLVEAIGRTHGYTPTLYGNGSGVNNEDSWGIQAVIGKKYNRKYHDIFAGLTELAFEEIEEGLKVGEHSFYRLIGNGRKMDHNCMWDLTKQEYALADNPDKVADFQTKTNSVVLGTWQHVTDFCCAGIVEFQPTTEFKGTIIACGLAAFDWNAANPYAEMGMFAKNMISYLKNFEPAEPTSGSIAMLKIETGISDSETNAISWFTTNSKGTIVEVANGETTLDLSNYKTLWIHIDRIGLDAGAIPLSLTQIATLANWVKKGGNLLLTSHATKLVAMMNRTPEFNISLANRTAPTYGYMPGEYYNSSDSKNYDEWGIFADSKTAHSIYSNLSTKTTSRNGGGENTYYPLISGTHYDHNSMWSDGSYTTFERNNHATVLGTWQQQTSFDGAQAIVEFTPTQIWKGDILACGIAAYDWTATVKNDNFNKFTDNMLTYVNQCTLSQFDEYPVGYDYTGVRRDSEDEAIYKYNPTTHKAYLYDAHHTGDVKKMFIRRIPKYITIGDQEYEVIGIDPRMKDIPLKFVDLDQGGEEGNRYNVWFDADVALNPHQYFGSHVIVYVLDRDFKYGKNNSNDYAFIGESTDPANRTNVCIQDYVDHLNMEDGHPLMFPGKNYQDKYPFGHAFNAKEITFSRTFYPGEYHTLILPFDMTEAEADAFGTFYSFTSFDTNENKLNFTKLAVHDGKFFEANTPYIFIPKLATMPTIETEKMVFRTIDNYDQEVATNVVRDNYTFRGSYEFLKVYGIEYNPGSIPYFDYATVYGGSSAEAQGIYAYYDDDQFVTSSKWIGMNTFRCYIQITASQGAAKQSMVFAKFLDEENIASGMPSIELHDAPATDGKVFNIMGQRVDASQPGLQIINGKKYLNRK